MLYFKIFFFSFLVIFLELEGISCLHFPKSKSLKIWLLYHMSISSERTLKKFKQIKHNTTQHTTQFFWIKGLVLSFVSRLSIWYWSRCFERTLQVFIYPASRGYIYAVWGGVRKVASDDNRSIFYRACAKFVTRFANNWFVKSAWVSRESKLGKLLANNSPRAFVLFFCFSPSGFKYFSRKISSDRLF